MEYYSQVFELDKCYKPGGDEEGWVLVGVVFAFSMTSQESANGTVFLGEACWTGLFPESGRGADEN